MNAPCSLSAVACEDETAINRIDASFIHIISHQFAGLLGRLFKYLASVVYNRMVDREIFETYLTKN